MLLSGTGHCYRGPPGSRHPTRSDSVQSRACDLITPAPRPAPHTAFPPRPRHLCKIAAPPRLPGPLFLPPGEHPCTLLVLVVLLVVVCVCLCVINSYDLFTCRSRLNYVSFLVPNLGPDLNLPRLRWSQLRVEFDVCNMFIYFNNYQIINAEI